MISKLFRINTYKNKGEGGLLRFARQINPGEIEVQSKNGDAKFCCTYSKLSGSISTKIAVCGISFASQ